MKKYLSFFVLFYSVCFGKYYSQCNQDKFVNENYFKNHKNGVFLDIGAHDGISLNNTYFFEKELNWTGICIEPIPEVFDKLKKNRKCICIQGCISEVSSEEEDFLRISGPPHLEMLSGLINKYDKRHLERIHRELAAYGCSYEIIKVKCYNINEILEKNNIKHINFLSLDTEGGEFKILKSIDFSKYKIDIISVEDNYRDPRFIPFLKKHGFIFVKFLRRQDLVFVHKNFKQ
jgi:FkbM family methyltransferase